ncbi:MAG: HEAT repeat domain-containing protein [Elusimicrobia bacterium]|nr:HEAT repeat domain-containing protein [Elusimicrobiota bacterium]
MNNARKIKRLDSFPLFALFTLVAFIALPLIAEEKGLFKSGVESYLRQDYEKAWKNLKAAVETQDEPDKARVILLRTFLEGVRSLEEKGRIEEAFDWSRQAKDLFSGHPMVEKAYLYFKKKREALRSTDGSQKTAGRDSLLIGITKEDLRIEAAILEKLAASSGRRPIWSRDNPWLYAVLAGCLSLVFLGYFAGRRPLKLLRDRLEKHQAVLESQTSGLTNQLGDLRTTNQRLAGDLSKALEENRGLYRQMGSQEERLKKKYEEKMSKVVRDQWQKVSPKKMEKLENLQIKYQEKQVLETLVQMTPEDRGEVQRQIAGQVANLYQSFPVEAIGFLSQLAQDPKPLVRLSIVYSLVRIESPEVLDILFTLCADGDAGVKHEALKGLKGLKDKIVTNGRIPASYAQKIHQLIQEEIQKGEWVI